MGRPAQAKAAASPRTPRPRAARRSEPFVLGPGAPSWRAPLPSRWRRDFPRNLILLFSVAFLLVSVGVTYLVSGGRPIFGRSVAGVKEDDLFYRLYLEDEARANMAGPKGGPDATTLRLFSYTINKDDSLSKIAQKTGVPIDAIISLNRLEDAHALRVGGQLTIPNQKGIYYRAGKGDDVAKVAKRHKLDPETLKRVNGLDGDELAPGTILFLPGAALSADEVERALGQLFIRPAAGGWLSSGFGYRHDPYTWAHQFHAGIDIALPYWTPIVAVRSGQVSFAGWNGGYGKLVIVQHGNGYTSFYGHMNQWIVSPGQWVRAGQRLGYVGSTGYSTGPHLHFELRRWGRLVNPFSERGFRRAFYR